MPLPRDPDGSSSGDENIPSHHPPWPYLDSFAQGRLERKYLEDGVTIHFDQLPKIPYWSTWLGLRDIYRVKNVLVKLDVTTHLAKRRLTGPEAEAISYYAADSSRSYAWIPTTAFGISFFAMRRGFNTFKFPFYKPNMAKFNPNVFPSKRFLPLLTGRHAITAWHVLRFASYFVLLLIPSTVFFTSYADSTFQVNMRRDPRLQGLIEDIYRNAPDTVRKVIRHPSGPAGRSQESSRASGNAYPSSGSQDYGSPASDDMSARWPSSPPVTPSTPSRAGGYTRTSSGGLHDDDDHSDLFDDDDMSPVAPAARRAEAASRSSGPSGSSWDRLRQQAMSGSSEWAKGDSSGQEAGWAQLRQDKARTPKDPSPKTDDYSYSKEDEEKEARNYEKEKAQREFDALLEAERQGEKPAGPAGGWRRRS
ncbi:hypothetical protein F5Y17DRAFT_192992 [Xylariaceae sp. FL0594]|nr:hypothetical protein F5Y17DRAFT_192992 [Xylariaceae sp. FL0594]